MIESPVIDFLDPHRWIYTDEEVLASPSRADGISYEVEEMRKKVAMEYICTEGYRLYLREEPITLAMILFLRFYARRSLEKYDKFEIASACVMLAGKIDAGLTSGLRNAIHKDAVLKMHLKYTRNIQLEDVRSQIGVETRDALIAAEHALLIALEYDLIIALPFPYINTMLSMLPESELHITKDKFRTVLQKAIRMVFRNSRIILCYPMNVIADALMLIVYKLEKAPIPELFIEKLSPTSHATQKISELVIAHTKIFSSASAGTTRTHADENPCHS
jgi:Cyclin, N-terminal domain